MDKVVDMVTDIEKDTNSAEGLFTGIATHTDTATDTVTKTDMDKNYQGLGVGRVRPPWSSDQLPLESAKIGLESVLVS